jgi:hypothetical protein
MAALYGRMRGNRGEVTRCGHDIVTSKLETWQGSIRTELEKDGSFRVTIGEKYGPNIVIAQGNVNTRELVADDVRDAAML